MHPKTALEQLEAARPGFLDREDPDLAAALSAIEDDPAACKLFEQRQATDRLIGETIRSVPIPEGLRERLHAAVTEKTQVANTPDSPQKPTTRSRRYFRGVAAAVLTFSFVLGFWLIQSQPSQIDLVEVQTGIPFETDSVNALPAFQGDFEPILPSGGWLDERRISFGPSIKGFPVDAASHSIAVREFRFRDPRSSHRSDLRGVLLTIPTDRVSSVPEGHSFMDGAYRSIATRHGLAIRSWQEDGLVYVCFVPISQQDALVRSLEVRPV
ncbi:DUF3379 domain-containing protein [Thalassoroseus pseudoceratinae]|uniref:DUF3379 domain-containing protein n=1 Tax=Thalassoroseus pseudoceratinae TaxID=2713176 RepID=UPI0014243DA4|nr:DUF3379 domain-containing protein [Thalassoroseus pseudoceratinae]